MDNNYIKKVIAGDTNAFRYLVEKYQVKALAVALSVVHNQEVARDVVQEAFVKAYKNLESFRGDAAFSTWLMRIVVNESIKILRRQKRQQESEKEIEALQEPFLNESLQALKAEEQQKYIQDVFRKLPEREALVLQLFYLEDLNLKEMEEVLELNADHIKVLLHRSRKRFYQLLQKELKHETLSLL